MNLERVREHLLADFALESLPVEGAHVLSLVRRMLLLLLRLQPVLEALEMDETDGAGTLARDNQRVAILFVVRPADTALHLCTGLVVQVSGRLHSLSLI